MIPDRDICWFDKFDYENMGMDDRWHIQKTAKMLTCFEMETKDYYIEDTSDTIYNKIYAKYQLFIKDAICNGDLTHLTPNAADYAGYAGIDVSYVVHSETTSFLQNDFIEYISINNKTRIDIEKLKRYLTGEEAPTQAIPRISIPEDQRKIPVQATDDIIGTAPLNTLNANAFDVQKYCFEKTTQSWNLRFMDIELEGVKDLVGMDYIAILLKSPGTPIGVIEIQAMLNPEGIMLPGSNKYGDVEDQAEPSSVMNDKHARSSKSKSLESLKRRLQELSKERNKLDSDHDYIELEAIDNEYAKIEAEVDNVLYAKNDDPEIKSNRDKVSKAIKSAIKNISEQKTKEGLPSTPLSNFLTQHIKTASECIYNPPTINPPEWSF